MSKFEVWSGSVQSILRQSIPRYVQSCHDAALMRGAIKKLGLMPALPVGDDKLYRIASYIYETSFDSPCEHWVYALSSGKGKGQHRQHVQTIYDDRCQ